MASFTLKDTDAQWEVTPEAGAVWIELFVAVLELEELRS